MSCFPFLVLKSTVQIMTVQYMSDWHIGRSTDCFWLVRLGDVDIVQSLSQISASARASVAIAPLTTCTAVGWAKARPDPRGPARTRTDFVGDPHGPNGVSRRPGPQKKFVRVRADPVGYGLVRVVEFSYYDLHGGWARYKTEATAGDGGGACGAPRGRDLGARAARRQSTDREIRVRRAVGRHLSDDRPTGNTCP